MAENQQQPEEHEEPIGNHGIVGDMHTVALIARNGNVNWMCYPYFDSPSIFAALLDHRKGGVFGIHPVITTPEDKNKEILHRQFYWPDTNVLVTRFTCPEGVSEIRDFMTVSPESTHPHETRLIRQVVAVRGKVTMKVTCQPALNYAQDIDYQKVTITSKGAIFSLDETKMKTRKTTDNANVSDNSATLPTNIQLTTDVPLEVDPDNDKAVTATFSLSTGDTQTFVISSPNDSLLEEPLSVQATTRLFNQTVNFWRSWLSQCTYKGRWLDRVHRSALVLKLLTFQPTGAIVAAPTMALPEHLGGVRNWDYRYVWIRDAAFSLYALMRIGFTKEAEAFMDWLMDRILESDTSVGPLQPLYTIHGDRHVPESNLEHLRGHGNSKPVRLGNAAYEQLQLDIYGELMDAVYLFNKYGRPVSYNLWQHLRQMIDWLCDNWKQKDKGIWEVRGEKTNLVYSRLMCWVALDRGLRLANKRSFPAPQEKWRRHRDAIYDEIMERGWNDDLGAFVQSYETPTLDASALVMPLVFFMASSDPKMLSTMDAILKSPDEGGLTEDSLVYRYNPQETQDGLEGQEGTFNMCSFWLVEALTRAGAHEPERLDKARLLFERMLGYSNHLGLYAEETGHLDNSLGNFPQAFTHLAMISAAFNLDRVWGQQRR